MKWHETCWRMWIVHMLWNSVIRVFRNTHLFTPALLRTQVLVMTERPETYCLTAHSSSPTDRARLVLCLGNVCLWSNSRRLCSLGWRASLVHRCCRSNPTAIWILYCFNCKYVNRLFFLGQIIIISFSFFGQNLGTYPACIFFSGGSLKFRTVAIFVIGDL